MLFYIGLHLYGTDVQGQEKTCDQTVWILMAMGLISDVKEGRLSVKFDDKNATILRLKNEKGSVEYKESRDP